MVIEFVGGFRSTAPDARMMIDEHMAAWGGSLMDISSRHVRAQLFSTNQLLPQRNLFVIIVNCPFMSLNSHFALKRTHPSVGLAM
jgi:hypothetical protein